MSLDEPPAPTLRLMKGKLESIEDAWSIATNQATRKAINEEFKALAEQIKTKYGDDGVRAVNEVIARHKAVNFSKY